jgi:filamentous hemagglutinin
MRVVVEGTASASDTSTRGDASSSNIGKPRDGRISLFSLRHIAFVVTLVAGATPVLTHAQVVGAGAHAPDVISTASGLQQVDINRPSAAGVSHNTYSQFDVPKAGIVLNNSPAIVNTQQAGYINGNPNLGAGQSAKIILNEVDSDSPSQLRGYIEVAGSKAQVVVANASGIVVDGGGFINTTRSVLTTGRPLMDANGSLAGYNVADGLITAEGAGLNAADIDQVDLIARAVAANAAIYASTLNVVTGANHVNHDTLAATPVAGNGTTSGVSIDTSQLGGMYANRIRLVGTEKGVGVSLGGMAAAQAGELTLTTEGKLVLAGKTTASGNMALTAHDGIDNGGTTYAQQSVVVNTSGTLSNSGTLAAQQDLTVHANSVRSTGTFGAGVNSDGSITQSGNLNVAANGALSANGLNVAGGVRLSGASVDLSASTTEANHNVSITAVSGDANLTGAKTHAGAALNIDAAKGTVRNDASTVGASRADAPTADGSIANTFTASDPAQINAQQVSINAAALTNRGGRIEQSGTGSTKIAVTGALDNTNGTIQTSGRDFTLKSVSLTNDAGTIGGSRDVTVQTGRLTHVGGAIGSDQDLMLAADSFAGEGRIIAGRDASVSLQGDYTNPATNQIAANRNLIFSTTGTLTNAGTLTAVNNVTVNVANLVNQAGADIASGNPGDMSSGMTALNADADISNAGRIEGNTVSTTSGTFKNTGAVIGNTVTLAARSLTNDGAAAIIGATLQLDLWVPDTVTNQHGAALYSVGELNIAANSKKGAAGNPNGERDAAVSPVNQTRTIHNLSSTIEAGGNLNVAANHINNVWQNIQTATATSTQSYRMKQLPWWSPSQANRVQQNAYYVNPADIVSVTPVVTPDGYVVQKIVVNMPANASAFSWMQNGLTYPQSGGGANIQYGQQSRLATTPGQQTLYAYSIQSGQSNPDQKGGSAWPQHSKDTVGNLLGTVTYSNQYGDCTTSCTRLEAYEGYTDPATQILKGTERRRPATSPYQVETEREATRTVAATTLASTPLVETSLAPARSKQAALTSGAAMNLTVGTQLTNHSGSIAAGGDLNIDGLPLSGEGRHAKISNTATQLSTTYSFLNRSGYPNIWSGSGDRPPQSWQSWTNPSITFNTGTLGGTITSNQAVTITGGPISNRSVRAATAPAGGSGTALGLRDAVSAFGGTSVASVNLGSDVRNVGGVRAAALDLRLPTNGLYTVSNVPGQTYLVQTDPRFTHYGRFISSDYMLTQLGFDPQSIQKRLGDGFYEQQRVRNQITQLTGRVFLAGYTNHLDEYMALLNNGVAYAKSFGLAPGIALSDAQMSQLTTDMVWLVSQDETLADGTHQTVLVPQLYLAKAADTTLSPTGALIAGNAVGIKGTDVTNVGGTIASLKHTTVVADHDIQNIGGVIAGGNVGLQAGNDILNQSVSGTQTTDFATGTSTHTSIAARGHIQATNEALLSVGHDVNVQGAQIHAGGKLGIAAGHAVDLGTVQTGSDVVTRNGFNTDIRTRTTRLGSTVSAGGDLGVVSGGDLHVAGSKLNSGGDMRVAASGHVAIMTATNRSMIDSRGASEDVSGAYRYDTQTHSASALSADGNATVLAGAQSEAKSNGVLNAMRPVSGSASTKTLSVQGSHVVAGANGQNAGVATLSATGDVNLDEAHDQVNYSDTLHQSSSRFLSRSSTDTQRTFAADTSAGSLVSGDAVRVRSGHDVSVRGSAVVGTGDVVLEATGDVDILAAENAAQDSSDYRRRRSGLLGSGGFGFSIGSREQKDRYNGSAVTQSQSRSTVGSVAGNVSITAGKDLHIGGSDIVAGKAADDVSGSTGSTGSTGQIGKAGRTGNIGGTGQTGNIVVKAQNIAIDPGQDNAQSHDQQQSKSSGLTVAVTGTAFDTVRNLRANASSGSGFQRTQGVLNEVGASGADVPSISVSYGHSRSSGTTDLSSQTHAGSTIRGGGDVSVTAAGDAVTDANGKPVDGDISVIGSTISASGTSSLTAIRNVTLQASSDQLAQRTQSGNRRTDISLATPSLGDLGRWIGGTANSAGTSPSPYNASRSRSNATQTQTTQTATVVSGNSVVVKSQAGDIDVIGSGVRGTQGVDLVATQGAINVLAGTDKGIAHYGTSTHQFGSLGSNGTATGFSVGVANSHSVQDTTEQTQSTIRSQIASMSGDVTLHAKQDVTVAGADLSTGKDLTLIGKNLNLDPGTDTQQSRMSQRASQYGVTLALGGVAGDTVAAVNRNMSAASTADDPRLAALDKAQALLAVTSAPTAAASGQAPALIKATVSVGGGSSRGASQASSMENDGSTLTAAGTAKLVATGRGAKDDGSLATNDSGGATDGDIHARGTQITAQNASLNAARDINLQSARDTTAHRSGNRSSNASIGVGFGLGGTQNGFTLELGAGGAKGHANGNSVTHRDTQIHAGDTLTLTSGRDTNLRGAEVAGNTVDANVGRDLTLASQQNTNTYTSQQTSAGFQASVCVPPFCLGQAVSGGANASNQHIQDRFQSVDKQSGVYAGDGGYTVNVGNHTQLDGAVIASTATPDKNSLSTQTLGFTDLQNKADYSGSTIGFSVSAARAQGQSGALSVVGMGPTGFGVAGTGSDASGTTRAAVSEGSITVRADAGTGQDSTEGLSRDTANANGSVQHTFSAQQVQTDMAIQQSVAQTGMQVVGTVASSLEKKANAAVVGEQVALNNAQASGDPAAIAQAQANLDSAQQQAALWGNDGAARIGAHAAVAAVGAAMGGGDVAGAVGGTVAGDIAGTAASHALGGTTGATVLANIAAGAAGAAAGGAIDGSAGALSGANGALGADLYNRQFHDDEKEAIRKKANNDTAKEKRLTAAACYQVRCWAEYSPNSPAWLANYVSPQDAQDLVPELQWVGDQRAQSGLFDYTLLHQAKDFGLNQLDQFQRGVEQFGQDVKNLPRDVANTRVAMPGDVPQGDAGPQTDITGGNDRTPPTATAVVTPSVIPCGPGMLCPTAIVTPVVTPGAPILSSGGRDNESRNSGQTSDSVTSSDAQATNATPALQQVTNLFSTNEPGALQIGGATFNEFPRSGKAAIFSDVTDLQVEEYFLNLTGTTSLPQAHSLTINGTQGIRYTVSTSRGNFTLRSVSSSAGQTGPAWTIDVPGAVTGNTYNREIKFLRGSGK